MSARRAHLVLATLALTHALGIGCGGTASSAPAVTPREPTRVDLVAGGCAPTWEEALSRVGPLSRHEIPRTRGYSLAQLDPPTAHEQPLPDACHYAEGVCRAVRYESGCSIHVDYRCGTTGEDFETSMLLMPCERPELP
jgi:hypothetical protein